MREGAYGHSAGDVSREGFVTRSSDVSRGDGVGAGEAGEGPVSLGYDFGTSGARVVAIDSGGTELFSAKLPYQVGLQGNRKEPLQYYACTVSHSAGSQSVTLHLRSCQEGAGDMGPTPGGRRKQKEKEKKIFPLVLGSCVAGRRRRRGQRRGVEGGPVLPPGLRAP